MKNNRPLIYFKGELFVFLLPLFFVFHGYIRHYEAIKPLDAAMLLIQYAVFATFSCVGLSYLFQSFRKACLFTFLVLCVHFFFGSLHDWMKENWKTVFFVKYAFLVPLMIAVFSGAGIYLRRSGRAFNSLTRYLNLLFLVLVLLEAVTLGNRLLTNNRNTLTLSAGVASQKPDIFLIVSDGYGGERQLLNRFAYDNSAFLQSLQSRGFKIVDSSISNYSATAFSMASLFHMNYLSSFSEEECHVYTNKNHLIDFLSGEGYEIKNYSFFKVANQFPFVPIQYFPADISLITNHTLLGRFNRDIRHHLAYTLGVTSEKKRIQNLIDEARKIEETRNERVMQALIKEAAQKNNRPRFVYAHFLMPHGPFLYDKNGKPLGNTLSEEQQYIEYLQYANIKLLHTIDRIRDSSPAAVIFLLSDHGYRNDGQPLTPDRFLNLNAVYLPEQNYDDFYKGMSNVNHFRIVLNKLFDQQLSLLKDSTVY